MKRIKLKSAVVACMALLMVAVLIGGCAPRAVAPPEEELPTIKIGSATPLTGPHGAAGTYEMWVGWMNFWKWTNEVEGGLEAGGKKYKIDYSRWIDSKGDIPLCTAHYKRCAAAGCVAFQARSTHEVAACLPLAERYRMPTFGDVSDLCFVDPPGGLGFGCTPAYLEGLIGGLQWFKEEIWKGDLPIRLGMILWDTGMGRSLDHPEILGYLSGMGFELVDKEYVPYKVVDFTPTVVAMKKYDLDLIWWQGIVCGGLARDAARLGMVPPNPYFISGDNGAAIMGQWAISEGALETWYFLYHLYLCEEEDGVIPAVTKFLDILEKYTGKRKTTVAPIVFDTAAYIYGHSNALMTAECLKRAIEAEGYPLTPDMVTRAAESLSDWDWGLTPFKVSLANNDNWGSHGWFIGQHLGGGKRIYVSEWRETSEETMRAFPRWFPHMAK